MLATNDLKFKTRKSPQKYLAELELAGLIEKSKLYPDDPLRTHNKYKVNYIEVLESSPMGTGIPIDGNPNTTAIGTPVPSGQIPEYQHNNININSYI